MRKFLALCAEAFRHGYEQARAEDRALAQPPLGYFAGLNEAQLMTMIELAARRARDEGVVAEKARVSAILTAPGAAHFPEIAMDLLRGPATCDQAIQVLSRAENDAATRAGIIKSNLIESSNAPTIH
jgi:hypothetical protein